MEFIKYTTITLIWWTLSVSFLLPLVICLKLRKTFQDRWFSWLYVRIGGTIRGPGLMRARKRAFELFQKHLVDRERKVPLEILEIGIGDGATLSLYPENSNLTVLDPNESMIKYFEKNRKQHTHINYKKVVIATAEKMHEIDDNTFDIVIGVYVLCSVKNVRSVLKEVKRVLKPGGKYLFAEHIKYPDFTCNSLLQNLTNPVWATYYNGCCINRNHEEEIKTAGFSEVMHQKNFPTDLWLYIRPQLLGIATK